MPEPTIPTEHVLIHVGTDGSRRRLDRIEDAPGDGWTWWDITAPTTDDLLTVADRFGLDDVSRDDLFETQAPKLDRFDHYWFLVMHALALDDTALRTVEVDIVVAERCLVTSHPEPLSTTSHLHDQVLRPDFVVDGPHHLAVRIAEFISERYLPILDDLDNQILDLEDRAVDGNPAVLPNIHALRRDIAVLRRTLVPQRRMLEVFVRVDHGLSERAARDLDDSVDHHVRLVDSLESAHQMVATVLDTYRGATAEKMNEVMKVLTVFSAIFMPLTLIAGIYGMNFDNMPELRKPNAYFAVLGLMAAIASGLWLYFVRREFIGGPKVSDLARPAKAAGRVGIGLAAAATLPIRATAQLITDSLSDNGGATGPKSDDAPSA